jgi:adenine-specific DNA-methyltransferase
MPTLTWLTREEDLQKAQAAPYRLLEHVPDLSYGDEDTENMLIQGNNLDALKALLPYYAGQVKCIYIDPPYNTGAAYEHYDDNLKHSIWLSILYPRLELLWEFLADEGSIWISIDDFQCHYLKVLCDEVFGRNAFVTTVIWQQRTSRENRKVFSNNHEYLIVYAKKPSKFSVIRNELELTDEVRKRYKNPDKDSRGSWQSVSALAQAGHGTKSQFYTLTTPSGRTLDPPASSCWRYTKERMQEMIADNRIWFGKDGNGVPRAKKFLSEAKSGLNPETLWFADDVGTNDHAKKHLRRIFTDVELFETPKPESLIQRVLHIASNKGDIVLDSFLGSGTTCAVAHKMNRKYIGVEMGEHAKTHCAPRLISVIDSDDDGISNAINWKGGGGFRFYSLGNPVFDEEGKINEDIRFDTLAAHVWFCETKTPIKKTNKKSPLLGVHNGTAYYLLFNGILGDKTIDGGNVLTSPILKSLPKHDGPKVIYGETTRFLAPRLKKENITFKQIPYDIKAR